MSKKERKRAKPLEGNTILQGDSLTKEDNKEDIQYLYWCLTYNGYLNERVEIISMTLQILKDVCDWYIIQEEIGENGNEHLQGTCKFKTRKRLTAIMKINSAIHWEATRQISASCFYCSNIDKRKPDGQIYTHNFTIPTTFTVEIEEPYGWQLEVMDIIATKPSQRDIHWFWEPDGNVGKSTFCKYLIVKHNALMLTGKSNDMFHILAKNPEKNKIIICNIPRSAQDFINYGAIEQIKDGLICSGKYDSCQLVFDRPHVFIFANREPDFNNKMSNGKWVIHRIKTIDYKTINEIIDELWAI